MRDIVAMLLDEGINKHAIDINKSSHNGSIALKYAIEADNEEVVKLLIERNSNFDSEWSFGKEKNILSYFEERDKKVHKMLINKLIEELHRVFTQYSTKELREEVE